MVLNEPFYQVLKERYGEEYCRFAGYFDEDTPFLTRYDQVFKLPKDRNVIQFSGAFWPFHFGHLEIVKSAVTYVESINNNKIYVIIHADHASYRYSKGSYSEQEYKKAFSIMNTLNVEWIVLFEDEMPNSCSRNFTRLYSELSEINNKVYFLCGGDRTNYALTFRDDGYCIVSGRDSHPVSIKYRYLAKQENIIFLEGNNPTSSTTIRRKI